MDLVIAVGGGGQHIALAIARLLRLEGLADPIEAFVIDADSDSRLAQKVRTFGNTVVGKINAGNSQISGLGGT